MSRDRVTLLNRGFIGSGALIAMTLLVSFYAVVSGAVTRAELRRGEWNSQVSQAAADSTAPTRRSHR